MDSRKNNDAEAKFCDSKVITSKTLPECFSESLEPIGRHGPLVVKIPVVIAEPKIQIDVESEIRLEEPALEIKRIKKNIFLTQCKLITICEDRENKWDGENSKDCKGDKDGKKEHKCNFGKLFISGFVRKNIEYSTLKCRCNDKSCISGDIRHTTCNVPFECVTKVEFVNPPEINKSGITSEFEIFAAKFNSCDQCSHPILGRDPCEQDFNNFEFFTEKVFCELEFAKIFEEDIHKDVIPLDRECSYEHTFEAFTEKMVIFLKLKLLQNQQVKIPKPQMHPNYPSYEDQYGKKMPYGNNPLVR